MPIVAFEKVGIFPSYSDRRLCLARPNSVTGPIRRGTSDGATDFLSLGTTGRPLHLLQRSRAEGCNDTSPSDGLPSSSRTFEPLFARLSDCYQSDLFYDYRTNVDAYPKWQDWMRRNQPRLLVIWGKYDPSFDISEPEAYRRDVPKAQVHLLDAGHFALDTAANEIAALVRDFLSTSG